MNRGMKYCVNCEYWYCYKFKDKVDENYDGYIQGECHRYPPSIPIVSNSSGSDEKPIDKIVVSLYKQAPEVTYPWTYANEWCGEFKLGDEVRDEDGFDAEWSDE